MSGILKIKEAFAGVFRHIHISLIPNKKDNLKQIALKLIYNITFIALIIIFICFSSFFGIEQKELSVIKESQEIWNSDIGTEEKTDILKKQNSDFAGWIRISGTSIDNPIYQTDNNSYYLSFNQNKKSDSHGAVFFDCNNNVKNDSNLILYGYNSPDGMIFGDLDKYRSIIFYRENPTVELSTLYNNDTYKIFAVFVLNSKKEDDNGHILNISRNSFINIEDFNLWKEEIYERSLYDTGVDLEQNDKIITLVTDSDDFESSRLIVMARAVRDDEDFTDNTATASTKNNVRYPAAWYKQRGTVNPFEK